MTAKLLLVAVLFSVPALADATNRAAAEALFNDARQLVSQGKYAEACPKFAESNRLDPATGTLLNLADCYEKVGKTASAWAAFTEVASMANDSRAQFARGRAAALLPTLAKLTLQLANPPAGAVITRDGVAMPVAMLGVPIPVDPGRHVIEATAPGRIRFQRSVDIAASASTTIVITLPAP
jgi:tetratricopeptide (TPR) repeat protein